MEMGLVLLTLPNIHLTMTVTNLMRRSDSNRWSQGYEPCGIPTTLPRILISQAITLQSSYTCKTMTWQWYRKHNSSEDILVVQNIRYQNPLLSLAHRLLTKRQEFTDLGQFDTNEVSSSIEEEQGYIHRTKLIVATSNVLFFFYLSFTFW